MNEPESHENLVEYLAIIPSSTCASDDQPDVPDGIAIGLLTFRMAPFESLVATSFLMTKEQLIRLRNDINHVLHDPQSWLYTPGDERDHEF